MKKYYKFNLKKTNGSYYEIYGVGETMKEAHKQFIEICIAFELYGLLESYDVYGYKDFQLLSHYKI